MMLIPNYRRIGHDEHMGAWIEYLADANMMPIENFSNLFLHRNIEKENIYSIEAVRKMIEEQDPSRCAPSAKELLLKNTDIIVEGLFAASFYTVSRIEYALNDITPAPFVKIPARKRYSYCPLCAIEDMEKEGSIIAHVPHQVEGVAACYKHGVMLTDVPCSDAVPANEKEIAKARMIYDLYNAGCVGCVDDLTDPLKQKMNANGLKMDFGKAFGLSKNAISLVADFFESAELIGIYRKDEDQIRENTLALIRKHDPDAEVSDYDFPLIKYRNKGGDECTLYTGSVATGLIWPRSFENDEWREALIYRSQFCMNSHFLMSEVIDGKTCMIKHKECGDMFPKRIQRVMGGAGFSCPACARRKLEDLVGEERLMNCGLKATIIAARSTKDIDVRFENGDLRTGMTYKHFQDREVLPENYHQNIKVGEEKVMNCGLKATVIANVGGRKVVAKFENGDEVKVFYDSFRGGEVMSPTLEKERKESYIGKGALQNCGLYAEIIEYVNNRSCTVRFSNGELRENVKLCNLTNGKVIPPSLQKKGSRYEGKSYHQKCGLEAEVIKYHSYRNVDIRYEDGRVREHVRMDHVKDGKAPPLDEMKSDLEK